MLEDAVREALQAAAREVDFMHGNSHSAKYIHLLAGAQPASSFHMGSSGSRMQFVRFSGELQLQGVPKDVAKQEDEDPEVGDSGRGLRPLQVRSAAPVCLAAAVLRDQRPRHHQRFVSLRPC